MTGRVLLLAASSAVLVSAQVQPTPGTSSCTTNSFAIPSWFIQNLQYNSADATSGDASFHLVNRATNYTASLACKISGSSWSTCAAQGTPSSADALVTSFQVSGTTAQVSVNQTWACADRAGAGK